MKNSKKWKKLVTLAGIAYFSLAALYCPAFTLTAEASTPDTEIGTHADILEWRFKEENGKLYRRLYNTTKQVWVGEWEYVADL